MICVLLLSQGISGFAAADPTENTVIQHLTDGWTDNGSSGGIVDFSEVDTNDTSHGDVKWFSYNPNARMVATTVWSKEVASTNVGKLVSFDLYIYDNTIPYEIRFYDGESKVVNKLGEIDINFSGSKESQGMTTVNTDAQISINAKSYVTDTVMTLKNKQWHKVEVIFSDGKCSYYINGKNIGSFNHGFSGSYFTGYQIVSRNGNYANTVTDKSGIYIDNFKSVVYGDNAQFYGKASVIGNNINVEFSESVSSTYTAGLAGVKVYNTKTEEIVATGTPILSGTTLTIPLSETLDLGTEYMIDFPNKLIGISGKKLYSNVYFYVAGINSAKESSENFDTYNAQTGNDSDIIAADTSWISKNIINIKDLSEDTNAINAEHKKVVKASTAEAGNYRWGIKTDKEIDTTKGEASVEFDIKIPDHYYEYLVIQPYSTVIGKQDKDLVNAGSHSQGSMTGLNNHFCSFTIMGKTSKKDYATDTNAGNPYIVFDADDNNVYVDKDANHSKLKIASLNKDEWHTVKLTIDNTKSEENYTVIKLYVEDELVCEKPTSCNKNFKRY